MGRPEGNPGNKGGGRKSAYQEFLDAQWHNEKWMKPTNLEKLAAKIKSGKFSVRDVYLYKALAGNERLLARFGDKILPDISMMIGATGGAVRVDLGAEGLKRIGKWKAKNNDDEVLDGEAEASEEDDD